MKRRDFFKQVGCILAALGLSEAGLVRLGDHYYQALAQPNPRKLALLIGINQYPSHQTLNGCLTDVELQRELLIHRFGFKQEDIVILTEEQATRQQIETAFLEHLTEQVQAGDVVVFHFSGYGRRVQLGEESSSLLTCNSLVPVDGGLSGVEPQVVNDLLEETLWLLLRSLPTNNVTTILDTSFNPPDLPQTNLRIRSLPQLAQGQISLEELAFQQQLRQSKFKTSIIPGVVLAAAGSSQLAAETKWAGFSAGLFTYALTQYLWEASEATTVQASLSRVTGVVEQLVSKQQPQLSGHQDQSLLTYHLRPNPRVGADGVVMAVEEDGKTAHLWLAGLPPSVLEYYTPGSQLALVSPTVSIEHPQVKDTSLQGELPPSSLQLRSRTGLTAKAQIVNNDSANSLHVGQLIQEAVRVLPRNINLKIALDASLERIERVDATSAFATIGFVSLVILGEQPADYVFGRVLEANTPELPVKPLIASSPSRYGLFSLSQELIPNTAGEAGEAGEAAKVAVHRLVPKLQTLLAAKLWRLTTNEGSSRLNVKAKLEIVNTTRQVLMQRETLRSPLPTSYSPLPTSSPNIPTLPIGSRIQYRIRNDSDYPVYILLLGLDSSKSAIALYSKASTPYPNASDSKPLLKDIAIASGETLVVPQSADGFEWVIRGPVGLAENHLIFSNASFTQTLAALAAAIHPLVEQQQIAPLLNPLEVAQAIMQDLHHGSTMISRTFEGMTTDITSTADTYSLDVSNWASLSFIYQIN